MLEYIGVMNQMIKLLTSTFAILITLLLILSTLAMFGAWMQADDFDREMNFVERLLALTPLIPIALLTLILRVRWLNTHSEKTKD